MTVLAFVNFERVPERLHEKLLDVFCFPSTAPLENAFMGHEETRDEGAGFQAGLQGKALGRLDKAADSVQAF